MLNESLLKNAFMAIFGDEFQSPVLNRNGYSDG